MTPIPDERRGTLALAAFLFLSVGVFGFIQPFAPVYLEAAGLTRAQIGTVMGAGTALALALQVPLGRLSDRWDSRRPLLAAVALLAGAAYFLHPAARGVWQFALLTAFGVMGNLYLSAGAGAVVGRMAARRGGRGGAAAYARLRVCGSVGYIVVALGAGLLAQRFLPSGPAAALGRDALAPLFRWGPLLFVAAAAVARFIPDPKASDAPISIIDADAPGPVAVGVPASDGGGALTAFYVAYFLFFFAMSGALSYMSLLLTSLGATPLGITATWATGVVCEALVMANIGPVADRHGRRPALLLCFAALPIRLLLYAAAGSPAAVAAAQTLEGLNFGIIGALGVAFVNDHAPERARGAAQARLAAVMGLALTLAPICAGRLASAFGLREMFVTLACVAGAAALVFALAVPEPLASVVPLPRPLRWLGFAPPLDRRGARAGADAGRGE